MNEDLEQRRVPLHIYTHRRLRDMLNRNHRRLAASANYITQNYNRFFDTTLTPNEFLNSISQSTVDELTNRQIDPAMEGERTRLLIEIDRYRKIRAILREVRAVLMIMRYNRLSKERRRQLNTQHLSETGLTFIEDIDRTMPIYPFYFRGLRTIIPQDTTEPVRFNSVHYDQYRLLGGNRITLGGLLPETLANPVLVGTSRRTVITEGERTQGVYHGHTRDLADDYYDLDDLRPTGREREESIREAEDRNNQLRNGNTNTNENQGTLPPTQNQSRPLPPVYTPPTPREDPEAELQRIRNLADSIRRYEGNQELNHYDAIEVRQLLQTYDERNQTNHGLVRDALGQDYDHIEEIVAHLRGLLMEYDRGGTTPATTEVEGGPKALVSDGREKTTTVEDLQRVVPDADVETIRRVVDLGRTIMRTRYKENDNTFSLMEGLLEEYDDLRLNPETAEIVRSMLRIDPRIGKKIDSFRSRIAAFDLRKRMERAQITDFEPTPVTNFERLREMINNFPDPNLVIFNHDVDAFHQMGEIVELYHAVRPNIRFKEAPVMKLSNEGRLSRSELDKLKRILQTYREIYESEELRGAFLGRKRK